MNLDGIEAVTANQRGTKGFVLGEPSARLVWLIAKIGISAAGLYEFGRGTERAGGQSAQVGMEQPDFSNVIYKKASPLAMVIEVDGFARFKRQGSLFYEPLREGTLLYEEEKIFVTAFSRVLLEERNRSVGRLVHVPALTTYTISKRAGASDLLVRSLFPNASDLEERIANQKANDKRAPRKSPLGRFDILSLQSALQNTERSLETVSFSQVKSQLSEMTPLTVYDLSLLTFLIPSGRVTVYRDRNGFAPVNFQFSRPHSSSLMVSVWQESPKMRAVDAFRLPPLTQDFSWRPNEAGSFALQALSIETGVRSQVMRIFAAERHMAKRLIPSQIRPNDVVVIPYSVPSAKPIAPAN